MLASSVNSIKLSPGDALRIGTDPYAELESFTDLRDLWVDGTNGDRLIVHYMDLTEGL